MPKKTLLIHDQVELIQEAMKNAGVWSNDVPEWIHDFKDGPIPNIWEWLQFIHLPMRVNGMLYKSQYLAPQLSAHVHSDPTRQNILQLVIELDSISPTIDKKASWKLK